MKRFLKLYRYAKAYGMKRPLRYALWRWWKGDTWVKLPALPEVDGGLTFTYRHDLGCSMQQCDRCGKVFNDVHYSYYPCPSHPRV